MKQKSYKTNLGRPLCVWVEGTGGYTQVHRGRLIGRTEGSLQYHRTSLCANRLGFKNENDCDQWLKYCLQFPLINRNRKAEGGGSTNIGPRVRLYQAHPGSTHICFWVDWAPRDTSGAASGVIYIRLQRQGRAVPSCFRKADPELPNHLLWRLSHIKTTRRREHPTMKA